MIEVRRCGYCKYPLHRKQGETPKDFEKRAFCGPACRRLGMHQKLSEARMGKTHKKRKLDEQ